MSSDTAAMSLLASETRMMESRHTGRTYRITISLPLGYAASADALWPFTNLPERWPVVYVVDGNWYAAMVAGMIRPMAWCGSTTDAIVVGIGYPEEADPTEAFRESFTRRNADLTPVRDEAEEQSMQARHQRPTPTGDSAGFLRFIRDELVPMMESEYRADAARRILAGHSYGGLFALFAMFEAPALFSTLIIGSPTLSYGDRVMFQHEERFASSGRPLSARVYLFAGELEESSTDQTLTDSLRMAAILKGRGYEGFSLTQHVFADQNHCEVAAAGFQGGLVFALRKQP